MFNVMACSRWRASIPYPFKLSCIKPHERRICLASFSSPLRARVRIPAFAPNTSRTPLKRHLLDPRRGSRLYSDYGGGLTDDPNWFSSFKFNRNLTRCCIGTAIAVYAAWDYSNSGIIYSVFEKQRAFLQSMNVPVPRNLNTRAVSDFLNKYFVLHAYDTSPSPSWLGCAFSHTNILHMGVNLFVWNNFANAIWPLSRGHYAIIILGSALTSSAAWVYDAQSKPSNHGALGSSGIVSGVMTTVTMFYPTVQASLFGILPMPLWVLTCGFFALDYSLMKSSGDSRVGHSAHLGGAAFGFLYYSVFLRRYGGIFGPRRF